MQGADEGGEAGAGAELEDGFVGQGVGGGVFFEVGGEGGGGVPEVVALLVGRVVSEG